ncbi:DUF6261 family protein [Saccharicrinis sp. 156]|uniref:DUF6261 family protein n=1 Tax=Saccharicrinis sp. 156 TaxID=3417574 RepID=UPI003D34128C
MIDRIMTQTRITEIDTVTSQILAAYQSSSPYGDSNLSGIITSIQPLSANLNQAINRIKSESELEEKDEDRDNSVRSFYYLILGFTHHPDENITNAAQKIMSVIDNYGLQIVNESYATESSLVNSLLTELAKPELQEPIALVSGAAESIAALRNAQNDFETSHLSFEQKKAQEGTYANATSIKNKILKLINGKLVIYLKAMAIVNEDTYGSFTRTVAQLIAANNENVRRRTKKTTQEIE